MNYFEKEKLLQHKLENIKECLEKAQFYINFANLRLASIEKLSNHKELSDS